MSTFVILVQFTDQGIRNVKDSPTRYDAFKKMVENSGGQVKDVYYTMGKYDMTITIEASDEAAMTTMLKLGSLGNVRTETLRAFSMDDMKKFIGKMPK